MQENKLSNDALSVEDSGKVPLKRETRMQQMMELPNDNKVLFVPTVGTVLKLGPYLYRVSAVDIGKMRFTATLHDVIIDGINDSPKIGSRMPVLP